MFMYKIQHFNEFDCVKCRQLLRNSLKDFQQKKIKSEEIASVLVNIKILNYLSSNCTNNHRNSENDYIAYI